MTDSIELDMRDCVEDVERLYKMESSRRIDLSRRLHELFRLRHCLVVTCTRVLYFSDGDGQAPIEGLLRALHLDLLRGKARAVRRSGDDAVKHLYELSLGITSPLYGEDTIVGQIGQAVRTSEECGTCSAFLSRLFRDVVAFSREMHGKYRIRTFSDEIPLRVAAGLGKVRSVLVVGSGELARMVGAALVEKGIDVGMTLRDAEKTFLLPVGAKGIAYDERKAHVPSYDAVVSASSGLYHTFEKEDAPLFSGRILFDLAVPYDIPAELGPIRLEDLDIKDEQRKETEAKLGEEIDSRLERFYSRMAMSGKVIRAEALSLEVRRRIYSSVCSLDISPESRLELLERISECVRKADIAISCEEEQGEKH